MQNKTYVLTEKIYGGIYTDCGIVVCDSCLEQMRSCKDSKYYKADKDCECDICGKV